MADKADNRRRLAKFMRDRQSELGIEWNQVAEAGGISYEAVRAVREGEGEPRAKTKLGIDVGLRWQPGSVQRILDGGEPAPQDIDSVRHLPGRPDAEPVPQKWIPVLQADEDVIGPFEDEIWDAIESAPRNAAGSEVFPGEQWAADVWDDRTADQRGLRPHFRSDRERVRTIAKIRMVQAAAGHGQQTGLSAA